jgi:hypothetical protein
MEVLYGRICCERVIANNQISRTSSSKMFQYISVKRFEKSGDAYMTFSAVFT